MADENKPKFSAELLHQLLGEYNQAARTVLMEHERLSLPVILGGSLAAASVLSYVSIELLNLYSQGIMMTMAIMTFCIAVGIGYRRSQLAASPAKFVYWQLHKVYELASRFEEASPRLDPVLGTGITLKLVEAQLLLERLEKIVDTKTFDFSKYHNLPTPRSGETASAEPLRRRT